MPPVRSLCLCLCLAIFLAAVRAAGAAPPNVLFIMADDLRPELAAYGSPAVTPNLDRLAARGVRFERAYCQQALCNPSRSSMLTGRRPDTLGIWSNEAHFRDVNPDVATLPGWFKAHGYQARCAGKIFHNWHTAVHGDPGSWSAPEFLHYANHGDDVPLVTGPLPPNLAVHSPRNYGRVPLDDCRDVSDEATYDGRVAAEAVRLLGELRDGPFFLAVGFFRPHTPYVSPKKYFELYPKDKIELVPNPTDDRASKPQVALSNTPMANYGMSMDTQRTAKQAYLASMTFMDTQFGLVLAELKKQGLDKNTIVIFISDHGYNLGEHGLWQKRSLYEDSARVPFIIRDPDSKANGQSTKRVAELVDLYPTVADLCSLTPDKRAEGKSLRALLEDPNRPWANAAYTQVDFGAVNGKKGGDRKVGRSVRTERFRYTEWNGGETGVELYDHEKDPKEMTNVAKDPAYAKFVTELKATLAKGTN